MGLSGAAIGTYRPQYRPLSAIRYLDVNSLPTRYTLFITLILHCSAPCTMPRAPRPSHKERQGMHASGETCACTPI
jgi:hypothetical protein